MKRENFSVEQWLKWIVSVLTMAVTLTAYAFTKFETKDHAQETKEDLTSRLKDLKADAVETNRKLDQLIMMQRSQ